MRDDVVWAARQVLAAGSQASGTPLPLPYDPLAPNMSVVPPRERERAAGVERPTGQADNAVKSDPYCCDEPNLQWNGDPDCPGIACENCGYVVAELGSVVIWHAETGDGVRGDSAPDIAPPEIQQQGKLFD